MKKTSLLKTYILFFFLITKSISSWAVPWSDFKKIFHLHRNVSNKEENFKKINLNEDKKTEDKKTEDKKTEDKKTEDKVIIDSTYEYTLYYDTKINFIPVERINPPVTYLVQKELDNLKSNKDKMILLNGNKNKISGRMIYDEKKDKVKTKKNKNKNKNKKYRLF